MNLLQNLRKLTHNVIQHQMKRNIIYTRNKFFVTFHYPHDYIEIIYKVHNSKTNVQKDYEITMFHGDETIFIQLNHYKNIRPMGGGSAWMGDITNGFLNNYLYEISTECIPESIFQNSLIQPMFEIDEHCIVLLQEIKKIYLNETYDFKKENNYAQQ